MKVTLNKKVFKIIIAVIIVVALIILSLVLIPIIKTNTNISKLGNINAEELEQKIIEHLKSSALNIDTSAHKVEFRTLNQEESDFEAMIKATDRMMDTYNKQNGGQTDANYLESYISAFIISNEDSLKGVAIPCFKIESDNNGNLKSIEYISSYYQDFNFIGVIICCEIENTLKSEYDIDIDLDDLRYKNNSNISLKSNSKKLKMRYMGEDFLVDTFKEISNKMGNSYGAYSFKQEELKSVEQRDDVLGNIAYNIIFDTDIVTIQQ